ncbi:MAG TPA: PIN domain-containing protein [Terriglobales bacterium]|nr:PIN domain-containing protein [Terriglobales bacterium]
MGLILDSSVVIAAERRGATVRQLLEHVMDTAGDQDAALSTVGVTDLIHGIHRAQSPEVKSRRQAFIAELLADVAAYPYTLRAALMAGRIDDEQKAHGVSVPFADLLIGATALSLGFGVLTTNPRHFRLIPGLGVTELS